MAQRSALARAWLPLLAVAAAAGAAAVLIGGLGDPPTADRPTALYRFAAAERRLDADPARTVEDCRELLRESPDYPGAHLLLGAALMKLNRHDEAETSLRRALAQDAADPDVHWLLGNVVVKTRPASEQTVAEAAEFLLRAVELDAGADTPPAATLLREQLAPHPTLLDLRCRLGSALLRQGNAIAAMWDFRDVLALDPEHAAARKGFEDVRKALRAGRKSGE